MRGTNALLSVIAGLLAAVVIVLIRADLGGAPPSGPAETQDRGSEPERRAARSDSGLERLSHDLETLRRSVDRLTAALEESKIVAETRVRAPGEAAVVERVVEPRPAGARTRSEIEPAVKGPPDPERRKALDDMREEPDDVVNRKHWFLTIDEVLQRYGPPDTIIPHEGGKVTFEYETKLAGFQLEFFDGRLLRVGFGVK